MFFPRTLGIGNVRQPVLRQDDCIRGGSCGQRFSCSPFIFCPPPFMYLPALPADFPVRPLFFFLRWTSNFPASLLFLPDSDVRFETRGPKDLFPVAVLRPCQISSPPCSVPFLGKVSFFCGGPLRVFLDTNSNFGPPPTLVFCFELSIVRLYSYAPHCLGLILIWFFFLSFHMGFFCFFTGPLFSMPSKHFGPSPVETDLPPPPFLGEAFFCQFPSCCLPSSQLLSFVAHGSPGLDPTFPL